MINKKMEELKAGAAVRRDVPMAKATENDWVSDFFNFVEPLEDFVEIFQLFA
jgi:hypothetical protein